VIIPPIVSSSAEPTAPAWRRHFAPDPSNAIWLVLQTRHGHLVSWPRSRRAALHQLAVFLGVPLLAACTAPLASVSSQWAPLVPYSLAVACYAVLLRPLYTFAAEMRRSGIIPELQLTCIPSGKFTNAFCRYFARASLLALVPVLTFIAIGIGMTAKPITFQTVVNCLTGLMFMGAFAWLYCWLRLCPSAGAAIAQGVLVAATGFGAYACNAGPGSSLRFGIPAWSLFLSTTPLLVIAGCILLDYCDCTYADEVLPQLQSPARP